MSKKDFVCVDCGIDTIKNPKDYYMVTTEVWNKHGLGGSFDLEEGWGNDDPENGMLCMKCLETRIGRKIKFEDLMPCEVNLLNPYTFKIIEKKYNEEKRNQQRGNKRNTRISK